MKIHMLTTVAGPGLLLEEGEVYEVDDEAGRDYCSRPADMPRAEPVAEKPSDRAERRPRRPPETR